MHFQQTRNQGLRQSLLTVSFCSMRLARHTWRCPCISLVPETTHEASRCPLKDAVLAQKVLQGSETEMRELLGGTKENSVSPMRGFSQKRNQKKIELVARPVMHASQISKSLRLRPFTAPASIPFYLKILRRKICFAQIGWRTQTVFIIGIDLILHMTAVGNLSLEYSIVLLWAD